MGYIKEPEGVDFIINGKPLTENQKAMISDFIRCDKAKKQTLKAKKVKLLKNSYLPA